MFVFLVIVATASMSVQVTNAESNCTVCQLGGLFTQASGYSCFPTSNRSVACTCPDRHYTVDRRCRICERENVCGDDPDSMCAESSPSSFDNDSEYHFACFCSDGKFYIGQPCPSVTTTSIWTTTVTSQFSTEISSSMGYSTEISSSIGSSTEMRSSIGSSTEMSSSIAFSTEDSLSVKPSTVVVATLAPKRHSLFF